MMRERGWTIAPTYMRCLLSALTIAATSASLGAQSAGSPAADSSAPHLHLFPVAGWSVGSPQKASLAVGFGVESQAHDRLHGPMIAVEPGLSAGRLSLGYVSLLNNLGSGFGVAAAALRTWDSPWTLSQNQTYVGGEALVWPLFFVGPRVGLFRQVTGTGTRGWFFTADLSLGF
jgi:hypothetical protein